MRMLAAGLLALLGYVGASGAPSSRQDATYQPIASSVAPSTILVSPTVDLNFYVNIWVTLPGQANQFAQIQSVSFVKGGSTIPDVSVSNPKCLEVVPISNGTACKLYIIGDGTVKKSFSSAWLGMADTKIQFASGTATLACAPTFVTGCGVSVSTRVTPICPGGVAKFAVSVGSLDSDADGVNDLVGIGFNTQKGTVITFSSEGSFTEDSGPTSDRDRTKGLRVGVGIFKIERTAAVTAKLKPLLNERKGFENQLAQKLHSRAQQFSRVRDINMHEVDDIERLDTLAQGRIEQLRVQDRLPTEIEEVLRREREELRRLLTGNKQQIENILAQISSIDLQISGVNDKMLEVDVMLVAILSTADCAFTGFSTFSVPVEDPIVILGLGDDMESGFASGIDMKKITGFFNGGALQFSDFFNVSVGTLGSGTERRLTYDKHVYFIPTDGQLLDGENHLILKARDNADNHLENELLHHVFLCNKPQ